MKIEKKKQVSTLHFNYIESGDIFRIPVDPIHGIDKTYLKTERVKVHDSTNTYWVAICLEDGEPMDSIEIEDDTVVELVHGKFMEE